jgi:hypothetical protein
MSKYIPTELTLLIVKYLLLIARLGFFVSMLLCNEVVHSLMLCNEVL